MYCDMIAFIDTKSYAIHAYPGNDVENLRFSLNVNTFKTKRIVGEK